MKSSPKRESPRESRRREIDARPHCYTCGRPKGSPFRVYDARGRVVMGCVDAAHDGHLAPISESERWHERKEAREIRAREERRLTGDRLWAESLG